MKNNQNNFSIIDEGFTIEGAVSGKGRLVIKGTVKGTIEGENVVIADEGAVYADARVTTMTVGGLFEGQAVVEKELIVLAHGKCCGQIKCHDLVVEAGGILNANVTCRRSAGEAPKAVKLAAVAK